MHRELSHLNYKSNYFDNEDSLLNYKFYFTNKRDKHGLKKP